MTITSLDELVKKVRRCGGKPKVAIAPCAEEFVMRSAIEAYEAGIAEPIFIGNREKAAAVSQEYNLNIDEFDFYEENDDVAAVAKAVQLFKEDKAALIMKGLVSTSVVLKAILNKETGVPTKGIISHVAIFESSDSERLVLITDAGVNIKPNLQRKADIIRNALQVARKLGIKTPKVAVLAAIEKVNYPAMPATLDADILAKMSVEGAFGDAFVAGPLALDIALSPSAATRKGVTNPVAGHADILCTPDIESGNILYKALNTIAGKCMASVVVGSDIPVVVPSRGDSDRSKFLSIALASYLTSC